MQRHLVQADAARRRAAPASSSVKCRPAVGAATEPSSRGEQRSGSRRGPARRARAARRYRAAAACRRARRWPDRAPDHGRKMKGLPRRLHLSVKLEHRAGRGSRPCPRRRSAAVAGLQLLGAAGRRPASASRRAACAASPRSPARSSPRPIRRPFSRAAITLLSLTTSAVARPQQIRQIARRCGLRVPARAPGRTTSSRAASRGLAGRSAMRSAGRSKSKRSVRMTSLIPSPARATSASSAGAYRDEPSRPATVDYASAITPPSSP